MAVARIPLRMALVIRATFTRISCKALVNCASAMVLVIWENGNVENTKVREVCTLRMASFAGPACGRTDDKSLPKNGNGMKEGNNNNTHTHTIC